VVVAVVAVVAVVESAVADVASAAQSSEAAAAVVAVAAAARHMDGAAGAKFKPPLKSHNKSPSHVLGGRGRFARSVRPRFGRTLDVPPILSGSQSSSAGVKRVGRFISAAIGLTPAFAAGWSA
jgi:hypothetical protein